MGDVVESGEKQWPVAGDQWGRGESEKTGKREDGKSGRRGLSESWIKRITQIKTYLDVE